MNVTVAQSGEEVGNFSTTAESNGQVTWRLDASHWPDGDYLFEATEAPDAAGNPGEILSVRVTKDTRLVTATLFVHLSTSKIPYGTAADLEVTIGFTEQPPESIEVDITLRPPIGENRFFNLPLQPEAPEGVRFQADVVGTWEYHIFWPGNNDHAAAERIGSFEVVSTQVELRLEAKLNFITPGQPVPFSGQLIIPDPANQAIRFQFIRPVTAAWEQLPSEFMTSSTGRFEASFVPDIDGVWQFRVLWDGILDEAGNQLYQPTQSSIVEITVQFPFGKVVIAVGGDAGDHWKRTFFEQARDVYDVFRRRGFPEANIRFLSPTPQIAPTDTPISKDELQDAILNWGTAGLAPNQNLHIYLLSDNLRDAGFILQRDISRTERLSRNDVHQWLEELNRLKVNVAFVMESCYSGEYLQPSTQPLSARRVFITSADARTQAEIRRRDSFTRRFFNRLQRREDFKSAFEKTTTEMDFAGFRNRPQVDADGDGIPNERADLDALDGFFLGDPFRISVGDEPNITGWSPLQVLAKGGGEATIEAKIQGGGVVASAVIFPPGHRETPTITAWEALGGDTIPLIGSENTGYRGSYTRFTTPGTYTILIYAENIEGSALPARTRVIVEPDGDANGDGSVDVFDLVLVANHFGENPPTDPRADVNGDGVVNILDLVRVAQDFGAHP